MSDQGLVDGIRNTGKMPCKAAVLWAAFGQLYSSRADRLRFGVAAQTESEGADHCGGISLGGSKSNSHTRLKGRDERVSPRRGILDIC